MPTQPHTPPCLGPCARDAYDELATCDPASPEAHQALRLLGNVTAHLSAIPRGLPRVVQTVPRVLGHVLAGRTTPHPGTEQSTRLLWLHLHDADSDGERGFVVLQPPDMALFGFCHDGRVWQNGEIWQYKTWCPSPEEAGDHSSSSQRNHHSLSSTSKPGDYPNLSKQTAHPL